MKLLKILGVVLVLAFALTKLSVAGDGPHCRFHGKHAHKGQMHLLKKLDLSDAQSADIKKVFESEKATMQSKREEKRALRKALRQVVHQQTLDQNKVNQIAEKMGALTKDMTLNRAKTKHQVYQVLTPEQQQKLTKLLDKKHEKSCKRYGKH